MQAASAARTTALSSDLFEIKHVNEATGYGVFATGVLTKGTRLFEEYPLLGVQHGSNRAAGVVVCERCFRFLGPLEAQMVGLLRSRGETNVVVPESLPAAAGQPTLPSPCKCPGGCELQFCCEACATAEFNDHHRLLCPGLRAAAHEAASMDFSGTSKRSRPADAGSAAPLQPRGPTPRTDAPLEDMVRLGLRLDEGSTVDVSDQGNDGGDAVGSSSKKAAASSSGGGSNGFDGDERGGLEDLPTEPLARFVAHCKATNEIFGMAAKAVARVLVQLEGAPPEGMKVAYEAAMAPFVGPRWWDAVATPDEVTDEVGFRRTLRQLLTESWTLLAAVLAPHAPAGCPLFTSVDAYARIVGAFERRNCAIQVASPVEEYFLAVDELPDGDAKRSVTAITAPLLDALDASYATPLEGTGLFPLQATLNHSCEPNVTLLKEPGDEEHDGRVVARVTRDVAAGEELCNSYVDVTLPYKKRQRELREYGFECVCARCVREAAERKEKDRRAGKKRLK